MRKALCVLLFVLVSLPAAALYPLLQSTASQKVYVYLVDSTDHISAETGITAPTVTISKNGGNLGAPNAGTWYEVTPASGVYTVTIDATDSDTVGPMIIQVVKAGCDTFRALCYVRAKSEAQIYSDMAPASTALSTATWTGTLAGYLDTNIGSRMATFTYTPERGTDSALLASNYTPERGTDSAMLASSYVTERGTDNALLATNYTAERGTNNALLASNYTPERGTDSALLASSFTQLTQRAEPDNTNIGLIKTAADAIKVIADKLATMYEGTGPYKYTVASLVNAPSGGGGGGDATAANQTLILNSLIAAKGATFDTSTDSLEAIRNRGDAGGFSAGVTEGKIAVDHNTGGADAMRVKTAGGIGISGATIRAYTKADYVAGNYTLRGKTTTGDGGRWAAPLYLDHGVVYKLRIDKLGEYGPYLKEVMP